MKIFHEFCVATGYLGLAGMDFYAAYITGKFLYALEAHPEATAQLLEEKNQQLTMELGLGGLALGSGIHGARHLKISAQHYYNCYNNASKQAGQWFSMFREQLTVFAQDEEPAPNPELQFDPISNLSI